MMRGLVFRPVPATLCSAGPGDPFRESAGAYDSPQPTVQHAIQPPLDSGRVLS